MRIRENYSNANFNEAVKNILNISAIGNRYFQNNEPWKLIKSDKENAHKIVSLCANIVKILAILIEPILPQVSVELRKQLNIKEFSWDVIEFNLANHKINKPLIVIKKIEKNQEFPLNLRVARIISIDGHPQADKLYVINVDLGDEKRQLVAGLKEHYKKEELLNKKIIVVANLKSAKIRGIESQGMLLAAADENNVCVLYANDSEEGDSVTFGNFKPSQKEVSFDEFQRLDIKIKNGKVMYGDLILMVNNEEVKVEKIKDGRVR